MESCSSSLLSPPMSFIQLVTLYLASASCKVVFHLAWHQPVTISLSLSGTCQVDVTIFTSSRHADLSKAQCPLLQELTLVRASRQEGQRHQQNQDRRMTPNSCADHAAVSGMFHEPIHRDQKETWSHCTALPHSTQNWKLLLSWDHRLWHSWECQCGVPWTDWESWIPRL